MGKKDIIFTVAFLALVGMLIKLMMDSGKQNKRLAAIEDKTGLALPAKQKPRALPAIDNEGGEEEDPKPVKLKQPQKNLLSLFKDKIPKTNTELKALYKSQESFKPIANKEFDNMLWNMKKILVIDFEKDKYGTNYWAPDGWFDNDGLMDEEYAHKIKSIKEKDDDEDAKEEKEKGSKV